MKKNTTTYVRGWKIYYDGKQWRYTDTNELFSLNDRPCKKCEKQPTKEGYDSCIECLSGTTEACCGHEAERPYAIIYIDWKLCRAEFNDIKQMKEFFEKK